MGEAETEYPMSGPGELLRQAREHAGLSSSRVAEDLHLKEATVAALEADDYDALPEPPYVRGYLKAYAKLVGADESQVLERYNNRFPAPAEPALAPDEKLPADYTPLAKLGFLLLIVGVIAAGGWWFVIREPAPVTTRVADAPAAGGEAADTTAPQDEPSLSGGLTGTANEEEAPLPDVDTPELPGPVEDEATAAPDGTGDAASDAAPGAMADGESPPAADAPPTGPGAPAAGTESADEAVAAEPADEPASGPEAVSGGDDMVLVFTEASWVEVRDAAGTELLYGLVPAGGQRRVSGTGPFRIFLGNAPGVEVRINGETVDFQARIRTDNTVRFRAP